MAEEEDKELPLENPVEEEFSSFDRQTIQELLAAQAEARRQEAREQEHAERRRAQDERLKTRRDLEIRRAREHKGKNLRAANKANSRIRSFVSSATQSLGAAMRAASEVRFPRYSEEGREQQRLLRALQTAMDSLRRIRVGEFDEATVGVDLDFDL